MPLNLKWRAAAVLLLAASLQPAAAVTQCSLVTTPMVFGSYNPVLGTAGTSSTSLVVECLAISLPLTTVNYTLSMGTSNTSGSLQRQLAGPSGSRLDYNLFTDAGYATVWGNGSGGTGTVSGTAPLVLLAAVVARTHTVYGRIPGGQVVRTGVYSDGLMVTIDF
jgi:spore coat protein U-like protein